MIIPNQPILILIAAALLGALLGSFLNVVVYRLPQMQIAGLTRQGKPWTFIAYPLSFCPACRTPIPPFRNIPVLSYLLLGGRAKCCGVPISRCYPLVELGSGCITAFLVWHYGLRLDAAFATMLLLTLLVLSLIDLRRYYLPDILTLPLLWCGLLVNVDSRFALLSDAVLGAAAGYLALQIIAAVGQFVYKQVVMGGGDFKLFAAIGAWLGWHKLPLTLFIACVIGVIFAIAQKTWRQHQRQKRHAALGLTTDTHHTLAKGRFCFGPSLSVAAAIMLLYGDKILLTYWLWVGGQ